MLQTKFDMLVLKLFLCILVFVTNYYVKIHLYGNILSADSFYLYIWDSFFNFIFVIIDLILFLIFYSRKNDYESIKLILIGKTLLLSFLFDLFKYFCVFEDIIFCVAPTLCAVIWIIFVIVCPLKKET